MVRDVLWWYRYLAVVDESRKMEGGSSVRREELREVADSSSRSERMGVR